MTTYPGTKVLLQAAREHVAGELRDGNTDNMFRAAADIFEAKFEMAFDSAEAWLQTGNGGAAHDRKSMGEAINHVRTFACELMQFVTKWSTSSIQRRAGQVMELLGTCMEIVLLATHCGMEVADREIAAACAAARAERGVFVGGEATELVEVPTGEGSVPTLGLPALPTELPSADGMALPVDAEPRPQTCDVLAAIGKAAPASASTFEEIASVAEILGRVRRHLESRLGGAGAGVLEERLHDARVLGDISSCQKWTSTAFTYIGAGIKLFRKQAPTIVNGVVDDVVLESPYYHCLATFCNLHVSMGGGPRALPAPTCGSMLESSSVIAATTSVLNDFVASFGQDLHGARAQQCMELWVAVVTDFTFAVNPMHPESLMAMKLSEVVPLIIPESKFALLEGPLSALSSDDDFGKVLGQQPFKKCLGVVEAFVEKIGESTLVVPCCRHVGVETASPIKADWGVHALKVLSAARGAILALSAMQKHLIVPAESVGAVQMPEAAFFGVLTSAPAQLAAELEVLGILLESEISLEFEKVGLQIVFPLPLLRQWTESMGLFAARCNELLLQCWAGIVERATETLEAACPTWQACFDAQGFNEVVSEKTVVGKSGPVVKAHKNLHDLLSKLASSGRTLRVSPALKDHPVTAASISTAIKTMSLAHTANFIIKGATITHAYKNHEDGPDVAKDFLKNHASYKGDPSAVADSFGFLGCARRLIASRGGPPRAQESEDARQVRGRWGCRRREGGDRLFRGAAFHRPAFARRCFIGL
ncbi:unnamed protein product [Prorocentrum cordatum]|uniref:Uncharacterized protein n=1 Tax=Prorocentrum cordatum TaxID=2364126 RepID=A0ABN9T141_9DINO|nr:unnamed protein product [Polarella glacialis]